MSMLNLIPIFVGGTGLYMLLRLRAFFVFHPVKCLKDAMRVIRRRGNGSSLALALAGTLGVGNIFGVAASLIVGGAGSLFWLLVSSLFSIVIKYSEATLTHGGNGMQDVIRGALGGWGKIFSRGYMLLCIPLSLTMGAAFQSKSIVGALYESLGSSRSVVLLVVLVSLLSLMSGNSEKTRKTSAKLIPFATIVYISLCLAAIFLNIERLPHVIFKVISEALSLQSVGGGLIGSIALSALREGFSVGILSNEAGAGTSSFAHTLLSDTTPRESGLFGMIEVFFDTVVICPLTALAILTSGIDITSYTSGMRLAADALVSSLGAPARLILAAVVFVFAISSALCWYYYGMLAVRSRLPYSSRIFPAVFVGSVCLGIIASDSAVIFLSEANLLLLSVPTLAAIIKSSDRIVVLSELEKYKTKLPRSRVKEGVSSTSAPRKASRAKARARTRDSAS